MRRTSPCTRIIGGRPEDRCRSDALFLTTKASSSVRSITILPARKCAAVSGDYGCNCRQPASCKNAHRGRGAGCRPGSARGDFVGSLQDPRRRARARGGGGRAKGLRRELRAGGAGENRCGIGRERGLEWHLIGPLQSNKTRDAAERFDWVQTVASEKIARRLSEQRPSSLQPLNILIQVNASGEASKSGIAPAAAAALASSIAALKAHPLARIDGDTRAGRGARALSARCKVLYEKHEGRSSTSTRCRWA